MPNEDIPKPPNDLIDNSGLIDQMLPHESEPSKVEGAEVAADTEAHEQIGDLVTDAVVEDPNSSEDSNDQSLKEVDEPSVSEGQQKDGRPTPQDMINAHQHLSDEQMEMSVAREAHLAARPDIADLPNDFSFSDREYQHGVTGLFKGGHRRMGRDKSEVEVQKTRWDASHPWVYSGSRGGTFGGERLSEEEAKSLYKDMIDPSSVEAFQAMEKDIEEAADRIREREKNEALAHRQEVEGAYAEGLAKGERLGETRNMLRSRLEDLGLELSEGDEAFVKDVIEAVAELKSDDKNDEPWSWDLHRSRQIAKAWPRQTEYLSLRQKGETETDLSHRRDLLFKLLGADEKTGVKWMNGWIGHEEMTNIVYGTILPDMIINKDLRSGNYDIQRNTKYVQTPGLKNAVVDEVAA